MVSEGTSGPVATIEQFMAAFIAAWPTGDATGLADFFSNDAIFHNGSLPAVRGRDAIVASFAQQMALGGEVSVEIRHMLTDGHIVMNERIDFVDGTTSTQVSSALSYSRSPIGASNPRASAVLQPHGA